MIVQVEALQDPPESHPIGIEEPCAVAGLQDEGFHAWIFTPKTDENDSAVLRFDDDRGPREIIATRRPVPDLGVRREWFRQHNPCFERQPRRIQTDARGPRRWGRRR